MKKYLIIVLIGLLAINCNGQNRSELFNKYIRKFIKCQFPITDKTYDKYNLSDANSCNITREEFELFVKVDGNKFWKYRMYSKQTPNYFNYVTGLKFDLKDNSDLIALIYLRSYYPDVYANVRSEVVLSIFNKKGELISNIPIEGSEADSLDFTSKIYSPEKIEVNYTRYPRKGGEYKITKFYHITKEGKIQLIK